MKALILEDELIAAKRLSRMITEIDSEIEVLKSFDSIQETAKYLLSDESQPDILLIDIHVADGNSFELFDIVDISSRVIFTTAYDEYAVQAFRRNATDYLLKPIKKEELKEALQKAKALPSNSKLFKETREFKTRFLIRFGTKLHNIKTSDIAYIYSENKMGFFITKEGARIASDYRLKDLEKMLNPEEFFRANRQFIIHIDSISGIKAHTKTRVKISLDPPFQGEVVISTERSPEFKKWLDR